MRSAFRILTLTTAVLTAAMLAAQEPQTPQPPAGRGSVGAGLRGEFQRPPRDTRPTPTGTAEIRGRVMTTDTGAPLRRAQVRLTSPDIRTPKVATTDTEGRYEFKELPSGRYTLTVSKAGYLTLQYGQRRPLEPGKPIDLADGQLLDKMDILLPRGGVITGRIVDEYGEPLADATVQALRYQYVGGQRRLMSAGRVAQTDDIGQFRIFGLPPGDYFIAASSRTPMAAVQAAASVVAAAPPGGAPGPAAGLGAPGGGLFQVAAAGLEAAREVLGGPDNEDMGYAPTYYPGTSSLADAQRVAVGIAEEVPGISFSMIVAKLARISGTVIDSQGQAVARGMVAIRLSRGVPIFLRGGMNGGPINAGAFTINGVPPGDYVLQARTGGREGAEFANVPVVVNGSDIGGLVVATSSGATVVGRVTFGRGSPPRNNPPLQIAAIPTEPAPLPAPPGALGGRAGPDGSFELRGLSGPNLFRIGNMPAGWMLRSVRLDGVDITDTPYEFKGGETITGLEIELTDKVTRVGGMVTDGRSEPIKDYAVVVFSDDSDLWGPRSRFVRTGRPDQDGRFQITALPPGRYLAVALEYLEQGSEMDPDLLSQLKAKATNFTLDEGEIRQLELKLSL